MRAVHDVVDKWESVARFLQVKTIDKIREKYEEAEKRMIAVLNAWLKGETREGKAPSPSWKSVVWVVADRDGGDNPTLAEHIVQNYSSKQASVHSYI